MIIPVDDSMGLCITQRPREADLRFESDGAQRSIRFVNPRPLAELLILLEDCREIRVIDRNREESNSLEFGRFRIEVWDEDNRIAEFIADHVVTLAPDS